MPTVRNPVGPPPSPDVLWKQYELHVNLYKSHMELVVKLMTFYYAITGAIVSYYLAHPDIPLIRWALALPFIFSVGLGAAAVNGTKDATPVQTEIQNIAAALGLRIYPQTAALRHLLIVAAFTCILVACGLVALFFLNVPKSNA
jgi:hypothetical protein